MFYAITESGMHDVLHVFEGWEERDEFVREYNAFKCTSKEARKILESELVCLSGVSSSDVRELEMHDLVGALMECDCHFRMHDNGLIELSRVTIHWEV